MGSFAKTIQRKIKDPWSMTFTSKTGSKIAQKWTKCMFFTTFLEM